MVDSIEKNSAVIAVTTAVAASGQPRVADAAQSAGDSKRDTQSAQDIVRTQTEMSAQRKAQARKQVAQLKAQMDALRLTTALTSVGSNQIMNMARSLAAAAATYASAGDHQELRAEASRVEERARSAAVQAGPAPAPATADPAEKKGDDEFVQQVDLLKKRLDDMFDGVAEDAAREDAEGAAQLAEQYASTSAALVTSVSIVAGWHRTETPVPKNARQVDVIA